MWSKIIQFVCYFLDRISKYKNTTSSYKVFKNKKSNLSYWRTWGSLAIVRISYPKRKKLVSRAYEDVFIEYAINSKSYRFYDLVNQLIIELNGRVDFFKNRFLFKSRNSGGSSFSSLHLVIAQISNEEVVDPKA